MNTDFRLLLVMGPALLFAFTIHEYWHGMMAYLLGDETAKRMGRLTLNPISHLDPVGTLVFLVSYMMGPFLIGWGKPVPYNPLNLKRSRWSEPMVAAAGPLANLVTACAAVLAVMGIQFFVSSKTLSAVFGSGVWTTLTVGEQLLSYIWGVLTFLIFYNLLFMVFNLIPIYPLDGSKVMMAVLPLNAAIKYRDFMMRYGFMFLIGFVVMYAMGVNVFMPILIVPVLVTSLATGAPLFDLW